MYFATLVVCSWTNIKEISVKNFLNTRLLSKHFLTWGWILNGGWLIICPGWDQPLMTRGCYPTPVKVTEGLCLPSWYPLSSCTSSCELLLPIYSYHCLGCLIQVSFSKIKSSLKEWDGSIVQALWEGEPLYQWRWTHPIGTSKQLISYVFLGWSNVMLVY